MNAIVKAEPQKKMMLLDFMADKYSLNPDEFGKTVRATCGLSTATPEQVAAFLIVAKEYDLNPLTKEIYAFPAKGGGVVPIVSVDGWVNLVNSHPQCDGFDFAAEHDGAGALVSYTCTMHRKDRTHPTIVTEYLSECVRNTEPWKMKNRMLRHKSFIQAARYAFGFAGIYDEDEGRVIAEAVDVTRDAAPPRNVTKTIEHQPIEQDAQHETGSHVSGDPVDDILDGPHDIVPEQNETFETWALKYLKAISTSPDTATVFRWIDANTARLKKLEGSPKWTAEVKKATEALVAKLRQGSESPSEGQGEVQAEMAMDVPAETKKPRGRPAKPREPSFQTNYDDWMKYQLELIAAIQDVERLDEVFEKMDGIWSDIMPPDRETLMDARREAESRLEQ